MKRYIFFIVILLNTLLAVAQQKLEGTYSLDNSFFYPKDPNILVQSVGNSSLQPFLIKGKEPFVDSTNRVGFIDNRGNIIVPPIYSNCSAFVNGFAVVGKIVNRRYMLGLINTQGKIVLPLLYRYLSLCNNGLILVETDKYIGFADTTGKMIMPPDKYSRYATAPPNVIIGDDSTGKGYRWELLSFGVWVQFSKYIGVQFENKWAIIDSTGRQIAPPLFDGMGPFTGDLAPAKKGEKVGLINIKLKWVIPPEYDRIRIEHDLAYVTKGDKTGLQTLGNKQLLPIAYSWIVPFGEGYTAYINKDGYQALLYNGRGKRISDTTDGVRINFPVWGNTEKGFWVYHQDHQQYAKYQNADIQVIDQHKQWIYYRQHGLWGLMDTVGREISRPEFDGFDDLKLRYLGWPDSTLIAVSKKQKWGVINSRGKLQLPAEYDDVIAVQNWVITKKMGGGGLLNSAMKPLTKQNYDSIAIIHDAYYQNQYDHSRFFISGKRNGKWALLDTNQHELTPLMYDKYIWYYNGIGIASINGKYRLLDKLGYPITDVKYDQIDISPNADNGNRMDGRLLVQKDRRWGVIDTTGQVIAQPVYEHIVKLNRQFFGKYQVTENGKIGLMDALNGRLLIPCVYQKIEFYPDHVSAPPCLIAQKDGYYGLIDTLGHVVLPFIYNKMYMVYDHGYYVVIKNIRGLPTDDLKVSIPPKYLQIASYYPDVYVVQGPHGVGLINETGELIAPTVYDSLKFYKDLFIGKKGNKFGVIDKKGKVIKPFRYKMIKCVNDKLIAIR